MKQKTDKKPSSLDIKADKLRRLKEVVPEAFDEDGRLNIPALERVLGDNASAEKTRYGLQWHGRADCIEVAKERSIATLKPARKESVNFDKTENLFIEGDNLEALKLLQRSYYGKVKMIYIDPPYNTGREFIYPDKYAETLATYLAYTGQTDENGHKFSTNTERVGRFHSNWLNMMFPRLYLARNLLRNDGVIFISIDDHEQANLKLLCDEIFGEENFFLGLIHQRAKGGGQAKHVVRGHDTVLIYARDIDYLPSLLNVKSIQQKIIVIDGVEYIKNDDVVRKVFGKYDKKNGDRRCLYEEIGKYKKPAQIADIEKKIKEGEYFLEYRSDLGGNVICKHEPVNEAASKMYSILKVLSEEGKKDLEKLDFPFFDYPKPVAFLEQLLAKNTKEKDIVLDFFAGSGTTAHAVMSQNAKDGERRRFICVQLPEPTEENSKARKFGFSNIADIGKERIRRAVAQIAKEQNGNLDLPATNGLDLGFKVLKLAPSNFHVWEEDANQVSDLREQLARHAQPLLDEQVKDDDVLYEVLLRFGLPIVAAPKKETMAGKTVYYVEDGDTLICLDKELTREVIDAMAETDARRIICLDAGFQKNDQLKTNAKLAFKTKSERKQSEVVFITL